MTDAEEIAKAIQASAKFGERGLETAEKAGGFFARVFKAPIDEVSGMITDKLRFVRWKRLIKMSEEVDEILKAKGIKETRAVPPKLALPIMEDASIEDDPRIQHLWNHLLANAMNPEFNDDIRYGFIEMIKNITAVEASLLNTFYGVLKSNGHLSPISDIHNFSLKREQIAQVLGLDANQYAISANNLMRLQLIAPAVLIGSARLGNEPMTFYKGIDVITMTPLGVKFVEACIQ